MSASRPSAPDGHIPELQSIRGIAAMIVVFSHCISYYAAPTWWTFIKRLSNSQVAVEIFFILSGLVLTLSLGRRAVTMSAVADFYVKRLFRIYPALWMCSLFATVYVVFLHYQIDVPGLSKWMTERFRADRFSSLYFIASWAGMLAYLIPPVWTVFVEIVASLLLPGLVVLLQRWRSAFWIVCVLLLAISLGTGGVLYYHLDIYLFDFALGAAMVAVPRSWISRIHGRERLLGIAVLVCATLALGTRAFLQVAVYDPWMQLYEALLLAVVIFAFGRAGMTSSLLRSRLLTWLGDISYSIYLIHFTVMCVFAKLFAWLMPQLPFVTQGWGAGLLLMVVTTAATLPLSHLIYEWIERPGMAAGKRAVAILTRLRSRHRSSSGRTISNRAVASGSAGSYPVMNEELKCRRYRQP